MRTVLLLLASTALLGCAHENQDYRVDDNSGLDPKARAALLQLDCSQRRDEILAARDDRQPDAERIDNYKLALRAFTASAKRLEAAFAKDPDLLYAADGDALRLRLQRCQAQARTFTDELRTFELVAQSRPAPEAVTASVAPVAHVERAAAVVKKKSKRGKAAIARKHAARHSAVVADASN